MLADSLDRPCASVTLLSHLDRLPGISPTLLLAYVAWLIAVLPNRRQPMSSLLTVLQDEGDLPRPTARSLMPLDWNSSNACINASGHRRRRSSDERHLLALDSSR